MKRNWIVRLLQFVVIAVLMITLLSFVVMRLWNWLTPALFGWHVINFWQAAGFLILSKILFGGFRGRSGRRWYWRHRMRERWKRMSPPSNGRPFVKPPGRAVVVPSDRALPRPKLNGPKA